jgi:predicted nucleic acid-binding protein
MMTAVDTNVLLDVLGPESLHSEAASVALRNAYYGGGLCLCAAVCAELVPRLTSREMLAQFLGDFGLTIVADDAEVAWRAGLAWRQYRRQGGSRERILTDFLIAAHALVHADALLTRDRGFYRSHFAGLRIIEPQAE